MNLSFLGASLSLLLLLTSCASRPAVVSGPLPTTEPLTSSVQRPDYRIGANDRLNIKVFEETRLDRDVRVNNAGEISLPLIGRIAVAGKTVDDVETLIENAYRARFLQDPQVSVLITEQARQRVTVEGAVASPGIYPIATQLSLLQAIAVAKGLTPVADEKDIIIYRTLGGERYVARFDLAAIRDGRTPDPELMAEDVVVVAESGSKVWLRRLVEVTPLLGVWTLFR